MLLSLEGLPGWSRRANPLAGVLLLVAMALVILRSLWLDLPAWACGVPLWLAMLLLAPQIRPAQRKQVGLLMVVGLVGLLVAGLAGSSADFALRAVAGNQMLLAMLVGVSFLRLVAVAGIRQDDDLPAGARSLQKTLLSTHILGSVLNMSAPLIVGDRLVHARQQPLDRHQGMVLLRGFSSAAFWSPFFGAMGLTLLSAPGASLGTLVLFGLPVAIIALLFTAWEISRYPEVEQLQGFPLQWSSLWMPVLLALLVILAHLIWPGVTVLTLVTLIAVCFVLLWSFTFGQGIKPLIEHVRSGLPTLCGEIALFLGAAVLASGVAAGLQVLDVSLAPNHYGALQASITLVVLIAIAMLGMHPVTTVALAGSILAPSVTDPNLLGMTFLMCWAVGSGVSPMSGIQLTMQARFGMRARDILWANRLYAPLMLLVCFATLFGYEYLALTGS